MIIGAVGSIRRAQVRAGGSVVLQEGATDEVVLSWWVGADDRWHDPFTEPTTRQSAVRDLPIVSTSVRIPSGDAIGLAYVTVQGPRELVVVDVENRSKVPFAVAFVLSGPGVSDVTLDGTVVRVGGFPLLHLPRPPMRSAWAADATELLRIVTTGSANETFVPGKGQGAVAFLLPVTHTTTQRCALLLAGSSPTALVAAPVLSALASAHDVANGWDAQLQRLVRMTASRELRTLGAATMLLAEPTAADGGALIDRVLLAATLDRLGAHVEAGALLEDVPEHQGRKGAFGETALTTALAVDALCRHAAVTNDRVFAETMAPAVAGGLEFLLKTSKGNATSSAAALHGAALLAPRLFEVADDPGAASQVRRRFAAPTPLPFPEPAPAPALSRGATFAPEDAVRLHNDVRRLVENIARLDDAAVELLAHPLEPGSNVEVKGLPTQFGRLSLAVRWHGDRAALLWECVAVHDDQRADDLVLTAPAHGNWSATGAAGEALLPTRTT